MKRIVLVDGNPLMWRAAYSKGVSTVTENILKYFFNIVGTFSDFEFIVFWDEGKSRWRSDHYTQYKEHREETKKNFDMAELKRQKNDARKYLEYFGLRNLCVNGVEADDVIAVLSEYFSKCLNYDQVIIASKDHDLWQLVTGSVSLYDPMGRSYTDLNGVHEYFSAGPEEIGSIKALVGDPSDNIKGVKGIGEKTAGKLLQDFGGLEGLMSAENAKELKKRKTTEKILNLSEDMELSYQLVKLPNLYNFSYYLNDEELDSLKDQCTRVLSKDLIRARTEADLLGISMGNCPRDGFSGLDAELQEFSKTWLNPFRVYIDLLLKDLDRCIASCQRCMTGVKPVLPEGRVGADFMVVTRSSSSDRSMVQKVLDGLEIAPERVWWTYVSKCPGKLPLTYGRMKCCSDFLMTEIHSIKPKMIFALGLEAMSVLTPLKGRPSKHSGEILDRPEGIFGKVDSIVSVLIDPDLALRSDQRRVDWMFGVQKVMEFFRKKREQQ
jgi:DNA polymerase-1